MKTVFLVAILSIYAYANHGGGGSGGNGGGSVEAIAAEDDPAVQACLKKSTRSPIVLAVYRPAGCVSKGLIAVGDNEDSALNSLNLLSCRTRRQPVLESNAKCQPLAGIDTDFASPQQKAMLCLRDLRGGPVQAGGPIRALNLISQPTECILETVDGGRRRLGVTYREQGASRELAVRRVTEHACRLGFRASQVTDSDVICREAPGAGARVVPLIRTLDRLND